MRVMVIGMIKEEPEDERFMDANPVMKNVHLVHQMINEQEKAIGQYLKLIRKLEKENQIYDGELLNDQTRELLIASLENSLKLLRIMKGGERK